MIVRRGGVIPPNVQSRPVLYGVHQPAERTFDLPEGSLYTVDVIDTWEMTVTPVEGVFEGQFKIDLPGKPYMAVRICKVS